MYITKRELDQALERHLRPIYKALGLIQQEAEMADATGQALEAEIAQINTDEQTELAEIKTGGEAIVAAGTKFTELKELLAKQATGALSDDEAQRLDALATEVDTHLQEGTSALTEHVKALNEEAAAA